VDTGAKTLANSPEEKITEGLDGLRDRLKDYYKLGARFTKWRGVYVISNNHPSKIAISANAYALARYSALVQEAGIVPIVEPEVLMAGSHNAQTCYDVTARILDATFEACRVQGVHLPGALLKPNMIIAGLSCPNQITLEEVAKLTVDCLTKHVPHDLPGIVFLSGGQSDEDATSHLNLMNAMDIEHPWELSYSYGRALLANALKTWASGEHDESQSVFLQRSRMNSLARTGGWRLDLE
jgi:fructose-bisphosphate aldolase class I